MKSAKATRWSREAILAIGNIVAYDTVGGDDGGTGGTGQAKPEDGNSNDNGDGGTDDVDDDDADDGEDAETLRKKLRNRREQAARQDAELKRLKAIEKKADELQAAKDEADRKGRTELENLKLDLSKKDEVIKAKDDTIRRLSVENAFVQLSGIEWKNPATALKLVDLSEVEFDQDTGKCKDQKQLLEAAKALVKSDPYLVKSKTDVSDDVPNGKPSGKPPVAKPVKEIKESDLMQKYGIHR